jgi:hypothetical protein
MGGRSLELSSTGSENLADDIIAEINISNFFRVEIISNLQNGLGSIRVDVGFFKNCLKGISSSSDFVYCGCVGTRIVVEFNYWISESDPTFMALPDRVVPIVEFGTGPKPTVRFESIPPARFIVGRGSIGYSVRPVQGDRRPEVKKSHDVQITLEPDWFSFESHLPVSNAFKIILDSVLRKTTKKRFVTRRFKLRNSDG